MTLHVYDEIEQRSDEWLALRCGMVTASAVGQLVTHATPHAADVDCPDCGAILGPCIGKRTGGPIKTLHPARSEAAKAMSPILTLADNTTVRGVAELLAAERIAGPDPDNQLGGRDIWRGIDSEDPARIAYAEHYGVEVTEVGFMVLEEDGLRIGLSPDGLVDTAGGVEIKAPRQKGHVATAANGVVPAFHVAQIQTALLVTGRDWWDFVSFKGGMRLWAKRMYPDPDWFRAIRAAASGLEQTIAQIIADYEAATDGFPMTDRLPDYNEVDLKL